jgi:cytochrome P450
VQAFFRDTLVDTEIRGTAIPRGTKVMLHFVSANRDEAVFPAADRFLPTRTPNEHVAFGAGVHFCLGAHLARVELTAVFQELLRAPVRLVPDGAPVRNDNLLFRRFAHLPVRLEPA